MNTLSWLIYAADVLPSVGTFMGIIGGILLVFLAVWAFFLAGPMASMERQETANDLRSFSLKLVKLMWLPGVVLMTSFLIPETDTIYMIAASEFGEQVATTPEAQDVFDKLQTIMSIQLDRLVEEAAP